MVRWCERLVESCSFASHNPTVQFFREYSQGIAEGLSAPWLQFTMNLQGKAADPLILTGDGMNEEEFIRYNTESKQMMAVKNMHFIKMILLVSISRCLWCELSVLHVSTPILPILPISLSHSHVMTIAYYSLLL
jgi:hypothetical protein